MTEEDKRKYPSNSKTKKAKDAPEKEKVTKVVESKVIKRRKPLGRKLKETFFGGDTVSVWDYVAYEVIVPAAKDMFADAISQGVERMVFGEVRSRGRRTSHENRRRQRTQVNYSGYSKGARRAPRRGPTPREYRGARPQDFDEIILETRSDADHVITRLCDLVDQFGMASVEDLNDLLGVTGPYTDEKWGWFDLSDADIVRIRQGYLLEIPEPEPLT